MEPLKDMPKDYVLCPATDAACPRARHVPARPRLAHAGRRAGKREWTFVRSLSPALAISPPSPCPHYRNSTPVRLARGMSHLFDDVPPAARPQCAPPSGALLQQRAVFLLLPGRETAHHSRRAAGRGRSIQAGGPELSTEV